MALNVNPTRMELINLKNKLVMARRGHKLLKDKLDELVRVFMGLVEDLKAQRKIIDDSLAQAIKSYVISKSTSLPYVLSAAFKIPFKKIKLDKSENHLVGIKVENYSISLEEDSASQNNLKTRFFNLSKEFDNTIEKETNLLFEMIKLADLEMKVNVLASEMEKTRRRVNALEYTMVPSLLETIKSISSKIEEAERSTLTRLMKVKDIVRSR